MTDPAAPHPLSPPEPHPEPDAPAEVVTAAVVDLLGVIAYGQLCGFSRLAADADMAPGLTERAAIARMAATEFHRYEQIVARLRQLGVEPQDAMQPFVPAIDAFHDRTRPSDWVEGLMKAYLGDSIAQDFYREVSGYVDDPTRAFVFRLLEQDDGAQFVIDRVREVISADPRTAGRLALWGRRLVGEAIQQAQRVGVERDALTALLVGGWSRGADLAELGRMFARLTDAHTSRMASLGLTA